MPTTTLTTTERHDLATLERTIERGLKTFVDVGQALASIRDERLYRDSYPDFTAYCKAKWGFERSYATRLIQAASVAENVANCHSLPANEAQARELGKLPPDEQPEAWETVVERAGGVENVTAGDVRQEVERRTRQPEQDAEAAEEEESEEEVEVVDEEDAGDSEPDEPTHSDVIKSWLKDYMRQEGMVKPVMLSILENIVIDWGGKC